MRKMRTIILIDLIDEERDQQGSCLELYLILQLQSRGVATDLSEVSI